MVGSVYVYVRALADFLELNDLGTCLIPNIRMSSGRSVLIAWMSGTVFWAEIE